MTDQTNISATRELLTELKVQLALVDSTHNTFETKHTKSSATRCRKHLMHIKKHCDALRREILKESKKPDTSTPDLDKVVV